MNLHYHTRIPSCLSQRLCLDKRRCSTSLAMLRDTPSRRLLRQPMPLADSITCGVPFAHGARRDLIIRGPPSLQSGQTAYLLAPTLA